MFLDKVFSRLAIKIIHLYQRTLSFDHGLLKFYHPHGFCRFSPTCSEYAVTALEKYGFIKGGLKASWRILRCNPWNKGGIDPVN
jgi:uncharacterized protein